MYVTEKHHFRQLIFYARYIPLFSVGHLMSFYTDGLPSRQMFNFLIFVSKLFINANLTNK